MEATPRGSSASPAAKVIGSPGFAHSAAAGSSSPTATPQKLGARRALDFGEGGQHQAGNGKKSQQGSSSSTTALRSPSAIRGNGKTKRSVSFSPSVGGTPEKARRSAARAAATCATSYTGVWAWLGTPVGCLRVDAGVGSPRDDCRCCGDTVETPSWCDAGGESPADNEVNVSAKDLEDAAEMNAKGELGKRRERRAPSPLSLEDVELPRGSSTSPKRVRLPDPVMPVPEAPWSPSALSTCSTPGGVDGLHRKSCSNMWRESISAPARFMAAKAAVKEKKWLRAAVPFCVVFRIMEVVSNGALVSICLWWVPAHLMVWPFLVLWYLPAVSRSGLFWKMCRRQDPEHHCAPWLAPLQFPLLFFTPDDFSWLRMHPMQRGAKRIYLIYIIRVLFCIGLIAACSADGELGETLRPLTRETAEFAPVRRVHRAFRRVPWLIGATKGVLDDAASLGRPAHFLTVFWVTTAEAAIIIGLLWVVLVILLLLCMLVGIIPDRSRSEARLRRVDSISEAIDRAMDLQENDPKACRQALKDLATLPREEGGCQTLEFCGIIAPPSTNPVLVVWLLSFHVLLRIFNVYTYATSGTVVGVVCSIVLACHVCMTTYHIKQMELMDPRAFIREIGKCLRSGIFTPKMFQVLTTDKGVLTLPALLLSIGTLPWTIHDAFGDTASREFFPMLQMSVQVAAFCGLLIATGIFVFEQFDLGIEREGQGYELRHSRTVESLAAGSARTLSEEWRHGSSGAFAPQHLRTTPARGQA